MFRSGRGPIRLSLCLSLWLPLWLVGSVAASSASARTFVWQMDADESQVANGTEPDGSTDSTATGSATITYDTKTRSMTYSVDWNGLEGQLTKIHIHGPAGAGQSNMAHLFDVFTGETDVLAAGVDRTTDSTEGGGKLKQFTLDARSPFGPGQVLRYMLEGRGYVNIHSNIWETGEIRANFVLVEGEVEAGTEAQDRCNKTASGSFTTVAKKAAKEVGWCVDQAAAGALTEDVDACFEDDPRGRIESAIDEVDPRLGRHCRGYDAKGFNEYPFFGVPDAGSGGATGSAEDVIYLRASRAAVAMAEDLFGDDPEASLFTGDAAERSCQAGAWRRVRKCELRLLRGFEICKRRGLKGGKASKLYEGASDDPFASDADLEPCVGFDPDGSVEEACSAAAIGERLAGACEGAAVGALFPGIGTPADSGAVASSVARLSRCRTCQALNAVNGMEADCDLADDDSDNDSCELDE